LDPTPIWVDATSFLRSFDFSEGRQHELDRMEAGQLTAIFNDRYGEFTPGNTLSPYYNLLSAGDDVGAGGWAATTGSYATQTSHVLWGPTGGQITSTGGAAGVATTPTGTSGYPVLGNMQYTAVIQAGAAAAGESCSLYINWYTSGGTFISSSSADTITDSPSGWTQYSVTAAAPSNAGFAAVVFSANPHSGNSHYFTCAMLSRNPRSIPVTWNQGQSGPLGIGTPIYLTGAWLGVSSSVFYHFAEGWTPNPTDVLNQETELKASDILSLLGQTPLNNPTYFPNAVAAAGGTAGYWRMNDGAGSLQAASYIPLKSPLVRTSFAGVYGLPPAFGGQDLNGAGVDALLSSSFSGGGSGALLYDSSNCATFTVNTAGGSATWVQEELIVPSWVCFFSDQNWSMSVLINFGNAPGAQLFTTRSGSGVSRFSIYVGDGTGGTTSGVLYISLLPGGGSVAAFGPNVLDNQWHLLCITSDASHLYVLLDNVVILAVSTSGHTTPVGSITGSSYNGAMSISGGNISEPGDSTQTSMQDLAIYPTELTLPQLTALWEATQIFKEIEPSGTRVQKALTVAGYSSFPATIDAGNFYVNGDTSSQSQTDALSYIQGIADVELGFFWQDPTGQLQYRNSQWPTTHPASNTSQAVLGDNSGATTFYIPGVKVTLDFLDLYTVIQVQAVQNNGAGVLQQAIDTVAQGPPGGAGVRILQRTGLPFATDSDALFQAEILLKRYHIGRKRVDGVTLKAEAASATGTPGVNIAQMVARQLWDQITFQRQGTEESPYTAFMLIEKRQHKWTADTSDYGVTWILSPYEVQAHSEGYFTPDASPNPLLGYLVGAGPDEIGYSVLHP
jgi:hypothetical protein